MIEHQDLPAGTIVGSRYKVETRIGLGGMGTVYRAEQLGLKRPVALKVILPEFAAKKQARKRFEREARVAATLHHKNAVEIYDFGVHENTLYLAMELLDGGSLRAIVDEDLPPLSARRACQIAADVADVLTAAAQAGLVHRDLKPENIIIDRTQGVERMVVVDFGLAFIQEDEDRGRMTREGLAAGTPDYMSPEQARGAGITPASDVYALGCVLYEMLTSRVPFEGETSVVLSHHLFAPPKPLRAKQPDLEFPSTLEDLVMRMLAKSPDDRPSARAVRDALRAIDPTVSTRSGQTPDGQRLGRAARMISQPPPADTKTGGKGQSNVGATVALVGDVGEELELALHVNGLQPARQAPGEELVTDGIRAVFAPGATPDEISALAQQGIPVVTDAPAADMDRLALLLRAGAAEVVIQPCQDDEVARKLWRAIRKSGDKS